MNDHDHLRKSKTLHLFDFRAFEVELKRLESPDCYFKSIAVDLQKKRDFIANILHEVGLEPVIPEGGYFIMADWSAFSKKNSVEQRLPF